MIHKENIVLIKINAMLVSAGVWQRHRRSLRWAPISISAARFISPDSNMCGSSTKAFLRRQIRQQQALPLLVNFEAWLRARNDSMSRRPSRVAYPAS